jgi:hypothetical protein
MGAMYKSRSITPAPGGRGATSAGATNFLSIGHRLEACDRRREKATPLHYRRRRFSGDRGQGLNEIVIDAIWRETP